MSLQTVIDDAISELDDLLEDMTLADADDLGDQIWEIADTNTPIYYSDILECVNDDISLFTTYPDIAVGDRSETPDRMIQYNIFERIREELYNRIDEWKEEQEEIALEADPDD